MGNSSRVDGDDDGIEIRVHEPVAFPNNGGLGQIKSYEFEFELIGESVWRELHFLRQRRKNFFYIIIVGYWLFFLIKFFFCNISDWNDCLVK